MCNIASQCIHEGWFWAFNENPEEYKTKSQEFIKNPQNSGRWLIFRNKEYIDNLWNVIEQETKSGRLSLAAEVSTRIHADKYAKKGSHVIAVYTPNFRNIEEIRKVGESLMALRINEELRYTKINLAHLSDSSNNKTKTALTLYTISPRGFKPASGAQSAPLELNTTISTL